MCAARTHKKMRIKCDCEHEWVFGAFVLGDIVNGWLANIIVKPGAHHQLRVEKHTRGQMKRAVEGSHKMYANYVSNWMKREWERAYGKMNTFIHAATILQYTTIVRAICVYLSVFLFVVVLLYFFCARDVAFKLCWSNACGMLSHVWCSGDVHMCSLRISWICFLSCNMHFGAHVMNQHNNFIRL